MQTLGSPDLPLEELGRLRDGTLVRVRNARPTDYEEVADFLRHVSMASLELRFLVPVRPETAVSEILAPCGSVDRVSLLLEIPSPVPATMIAHGEYRRSRSEPNRAEVGFLVVDDHHGEGAATLLLTYLARRARWAGIRQFDAVTRPGNQGMIDVFVGGGFPCSFSVHDRLEHVALDITREPSIASVRLGLVGNRSRLRA